LQIHYKAKLRKTNGDAEVRVGMQIEAGVFKIDLKGYRLGVATKTVFFLRTKNKEQRVNPLDLSMKLKARTWSLSFWFSVGVGN